MKRYRLFLFIALLVIFATKTLSAADGGYKIKVKIAGLKDTVCHLANHYGDKQYYRDTARVDDKGNMVFEGKDILPGGIYLIVIPSKKYFEIIIDQSMNFSLETDTIDFVKNMKIKGSPENEAFYDYLKFINDRGQQMTKLSDLLKNLKENPDSTKLLKDQISKVDKEVVDYKKNYIDKNPKAFQTKLFKAMNDPEVPEAPLLSNGKKDSTFAYKYFKAHYFDNIDFTDERILRTPVFHKKLEYYMKNLTFQIPDSIDVAADYIASKAKANKELFKYVVYWITNNYERSNIVGMDAVFVHMVEEYYMTKQAYWVDSTQLVKIMDRAKQVKPLLLGKVTPELLLLDTNGVYHSLHSIKGKYTILVFWDPDCGHCQKEIPKLYEDYEKLKADGIDLAIFAVCTDGDVKKMKKFIVEKKVKWLNVYDPYNQSNFHKIYDIFSTPVIYLLDVDKKIISKRISAENVDEFVRREYKMEKEKKK